jgi:hypothetical protein
MIPVWSWRALADDIATPQRLLRLAQTVRDLYGLTSAVGTFPDGETMPSVAGASTWIVENTAATAIAALTAGSPGRTVRLWATTPNTTLVHSAALLMKGAANVTMTAIETRAFVTVDGSNFREI